MVEEKLTEIKVGYYCENCFKDSIPKDKALIDEIGNVFCSLKCRNESMTLNRTFEPLTDKQDGLLLLDFRQQYWEEWVNYCHEQGYEAELVEEDLI